MVIGKRVDEYRVIVYGGASGIDTNHRATVLLFDDDSKCVGSIKFFDQGTSLREDYEKHGTIRMFLSSDMFLNIVDVLRNEKPVYIHGVPGEYYLSTDKEPVGEAEED